MSKYIAQNEETEVNNSHLTAGEAYEADGQNPMGSNKTAGTTLGGAMMAILEQGFASILDKTADWVSFAGDIQNQDNSSQIVRRMEFKVTQRAQGAWIAMFGNRNAEAVEKGLEADKRTVRFSAYENRNYWEAQWEAIRDEADSKYGPSAKKVNTMLRLEEARLNYEVCLAELKLWTELYAHLTDKAYIYVPYKEAAAVESEPTRTNFALYDKLTKSTLIKKSA